MVEWICRKIIMIIRIIIICNVFPAAMRFADAKYVKLLWVTTAAARTVAATQSNCPQIELMLTCGGTL